MVFENLGRAQHISAPTLALLAGVGARCFCFLGTGYSSGSCRPPSFFLYTTFTSLLPVGTDTVHWPSVVR